MRFQATFDETIMITGLMNQGRNQGNDYVTHYKVQYTEDGVTWETLNNDIGVENVRWDYTQEYNSKTPENINDFRNNFALGCVIYGWT